MNLISTTDVLKMSPLDLLNRADSSVRNDLGRFIREFNRREWYVRILKSYNFDEYIQHAYIHHDSFGFGFVVDGMPVPYFHPNRSFHDEIIWLNKHLYYDKEVSFTNKLLNSAIVKFYGPSRTLDIITGFAADLPYLKKTKSKFVDFDAIHSGDRDYEYDVMSNIDVASSNKEKIWGTTELRTSLQTASRNYARKNPSVVDHISGIHSHDRPMRASDMIHWISSIGKTYSGEDDYVLNMIDYYKVVKPTMKESYEYLTSYRGIGPYYGYHFSSNLARMPGVGDSVLIDREYKERFSSLGIDHGSLDENADYVVAGPGACKTLSMLFHDLPINNKTSMKMILSIRDHQEEFFGIDNKESLRHLHEATELGRFTTFGAEIACCQFSVFDRIRTDKYMAINRAKAPISMEAGKSSGSDLSNFL
jgi:hypothetical protein